MNLQRQRKQHITARFNRIYCNEKSAFSGLFSWIWILQTLYDQLLRYFLSLFQLQIFVPICSSFPLGSWWLMHLPSRFISIKEVEKLPNILFCGNKRFSVILHFYIPTATSIRIFSLTYTDTNIWEFVSDFSSRYIYSGSEQTEEKKAALFALFFSDETVSLLSLP